jgi:5-methylcytosine-specific restriction endonuclease McrA
LESSDRTRQLDFIYRRDRGICQICLKHVNREDASRDHIKKLSECTKEEARNLDNMRLAHKACNEARTDYEDIVVPLVVRNRNGKPRLTTKIGDLFPDLHDMFRGSVEDQLSG